MKARLRNAVAALVTLAVLGSPGAVSAQGREVVEHLGASLHQPVYGHGGMVVSQNEIASRVGAEILRKGGNAVDAAVATALALSVVLPRAGNIGGDGFMLIWLADEKRAVAIDYRSVAPQKARLEMYVGEDGKELDAASEGYLAPSVPGTVAGLHHAQTRYGKLPWRAVVEPAIALARDGFALTFEQASVFKLGEKRLSVSAAAAKAFRKADGTAYRPGEVLRQPDLAWTLTQISDRGADGFYKGPVAEKFAADMKAHGGLITAADLAAYRVRERTPLAGSYRGLEVYAMPPASSGGAALLEMLNILEGYDLTARRQGSADAIHLMSEAMKLAAADRIAFLGDPDFGKVPLAGMVSKAYARQRAASISLTRATAPKAFPDGDPWKFESPNTTHFSVADAHGNAVSNTFTLGSDFGSGVMVEGAGFMLNNQMNNYAHEDALKARRAGRKPPANALAPGKRMLSSMTPTIVMKEGRPWLVTGSPGASTIINTVLQMVVNTVDYGMNVAEATHAPRIYQGWTDELSLEPTFSADTADKLRAMGHRVTTARAVIGSTQSIMVQGDLFQGAADPRRPDAGAVAAAP